MGFTVRPTRSSCRSRISQTETRRRSVCRLTPQFSRRSGRPTAEYIAVGNITPNAIELWVIDTATGKATQVKNIRMNTAFGGLDWMPDQRNLLVNIVPTNRGPRRNMRTSCRPNRPYRKHRTPQRRGANVRRPDEKPERRKVVRVLLHVAACCRFARRTSKKHWAARYV